MRTVFVIGAGANVEIGMPCGKKLKKDIVDFLDFSSVYADKRPKSFDVFYAMKNVFRDEWTILNIASRIIEAMPFAISIDNFLDAHRLEYGIDKAGKIVIVAAIIAAEKQSYLFNMMELKNEIDETWYPRLFEKITENCEINQLIERLKSISFIIFNYDRCFEFYMIHALDAYYHIGKESAYSMVKNMNIIHPYGYIGDLKKVPLGKDIDYKLLIELYKNIRTFTEDSEETKKERIVIKQLIDRTNRIIFLGFAYHQMNLDLIFKNKEYESTVPDPAPLSRLVECYGTGFSISENDRKYIQSLLMRMDSRIGNSDISDCKCAKFFNEFDRRISF